MYRRTLLSGLSTLGFWALGEGKAMGPHEPISLIGAGHPERSPAPDSAEILWRHLRDDVPRVSVLDRRLAFEKRHPEVIITPSGHTRSGLWEADWPDRAADEIVRHDSCAGLLDLLEARFDQDSVG